ncbi:hypothetical protein M430DRAFT_19108 [Amorphotheca resinae ATCC 22711]|uniref:Uncharacterized protein n=1 Tax=Amorphotheca resinae ATCC 22711 TaxID=857342 RepID=A0A2T3B1U0_AMORE|nr:hypothetical protein M430DRAFT_19108 [Amorphotheca resinae ATCC 22711]PSS18509.1 hypothetical protein M430DRAFT_19108 [Amorphotheca resinae ATCC 22711]
MALYLRIRKSGRLIAYKSINRQCWPPTEEQIQHTYPIPLVLLPKDMEAKRRKA